MLCKKRCCEEKGLVGSLGVSGNVVNYHGMIVWISVG
jgi:hypothetical protein